MSGLSESDIKEARLWYHDDFESVASIARTFGVSVATVRRALGLGAEVDPNAVLIDVPAAARILGISKHALYHRIERGQLPGHVLVRTGRGKRSRIQFHRTRLLAAIERRAGR